MEAKEKINISQIENVIKYYVLMAKWLMKWGIMLEQNTSR